MIDNLTEAISHAREEAKEYRKTADGWYAGGCSYAQAEGNVCLECAKDNEQIAEWLEELKDYREGKRTCENCKHQDKAEDQYPCSICRCNHPNKFEWAKRKRGNK